MLLGLFWMMVKNRCMSSSGIHFCPQYLLYNPKVGGNTCTQYHYKSVMAIESFCDFSNL